MDFNELTNEQLNQAYQGLKKKVLDNSLPLDQRKKAREQAKAVLNVEKARRKNPSDSEKIAEEVQGFNQRALNSFLTIAGMPADLAVNITDRYMKYIEPVANKMRESFGKDPVQLESAGAPQVLPTSENLKKSVENLGEFVGVDMLGDYQRPAEGTGERLGEVAGEVGTFFFPMLKGAQLINTARGLTAPKSVIQAVSKNITEEAAKAPKRLLTAEASAVPAIAGARYASEEMDLGPGASTTLQMLAGIGAPMSVYALSKTPTAQAIKYTTEQVSKLKAPAKINSKEGKKAAKVLQDLAENPDAVVKRLEATEGDPNLTVAQRTEDKLLTSLEAKLIANAEGPRGTLNKNAEGQAIVNKLKDNILNIGTNIKDTVKVAKLRLESFNDSIKGRIIQAGNDLNETLTKLKGNNPDKSPSEIQSISNLAVRETLEKALDDVTAVEQRMWYRLPLSVKGSQENLVKTLSEIVKKTGRAQLDDIPEAAKFINTRMYKKDGKLNTVKESVKELKALYTKLGETSRKAIVNGDANKARISERLQEAILKDMDNWTGKGATVNTRIKEAREFSRLKNKYFKQGTVGEYLGYAKKGELRVAPSLTVEKILQGSAQNRLLKAIDITEAEKFSKSAIGEINTELSTLSGLDDYMRASFLREAFDDGILNPAKSRSFLKANENVLELLPATKIQLMRSREQADVLKKITKAKDIYDRRTSTKADSTLARILNSDPDNIIKKVLSADSPNKVQQMQLIVNLAKKDKSGLATEGLKNAIARYLVDEATAISPISVNNGRPNIDANRLLNRLIDDKTLDESMRLVFSQKEMSDIRYAVKQMKLIQDSNASIDVPIPSVDDSIIQKLFRIIGVKAGAQLGGGQVGSPLVLAGEGRKVGEQLFRRFNPNKTQALLAQAFQDEALMKILLKKGVSDKKGGFKLNLTKPEVKTLRSYLVAPFVEEKGQEEFIEQREFRNQQIINELLAQ